MCRDGLGEEKKRGHFREAAADYERASRGSPDSNSRKMRRRHLIFRDADQRAAAVVSLQLPFLS